MQAKMHLYARTISEKPCHVRLDWKTTSLLVTHNRYILMINILNDMIVGSPLTWSNSMKLDRLVTVTLLKPVGPLNFFI